MGTLYEPVQPISKQDKLAKTGFGLGLMTMIFPIISIIYLVLKNGGQGYLQSLVIGIPFAIASLITGIVALAQRNKNQKSGWMAILGIIFGILFFGISGILVVILLTPFIMGTAH